MERRTSYSCSGIIVRICRVQLDLARGLMWGWMRCSPIEKSVLFVTNNATKSRKNYKKKFDSLGVEAHVVCLSPLVRLCRRYG